MNALRELPVLLLLVLAAAGSVACGGAEEETSRTSDSDITGESGVGRGEMCGGFAGDVCAKGLHCDNSLGLGTGYCVGKEGEDEDATGDDADEDASPDAGEGADEPIEGEGAMCGGFAGDVCAEGLRCDNSIGLGTGYCVRD